MALLIDAVWTAVLGPAFAYPPNFSHLSNTSIFGFEKAPIDPPTISDSFIAVQKAQIQQGFKDACALALACFAAVKDQQAKNNSRVYSKYFPTGSHDADGSHLNNVRMISGNIIGENTNICSEDLGDSTIRTDFPNTDNDNKLSCTKKSTMASTGNGADESVKPTMVLCDSALAHGHIRPDKIAGARYLRHRERRRPANDLANGHPRCHNLA
jgi:hypothetical protein